MEDNKTIATYGINGVCTHLGCVVPWNAAENEFTCPAMDDGSQYNNQGKVVRGPAPLVSPHSSLSLLYIVISFVQLLLIYVGVKIELDT